MNSFFSEHGTKIYGALTTLFGTVGGLVTTGAFKDLLSPIAIGWLGIICTVSTAVIGAMTLSRGFTNSAQIKVAQTVQAALEATPPKQGGFARPGFIAMLLVAVLLAVALTSCSNNSPMEEAGYQVATRQLTSRYIWDAKTPEKREARAKRVRAIATDIRALAAGGEAVTLAGLRLATLNELKKHDLTPPDRDLALGLIDALDAYLKTKVRDGVLDADERLTVEKVMGWVLAGATLEPTPVE